MAKSDRGSVSMTFGFDLSEPGKIGITINTPTSPAPVPVPVPVESQQRTILFTGFKAADKERLKALATKHDLIVSKTVTGRLTFIVRGPTAGPGKTRDALLEGAIMLTEPQFIHLLETGELPAKV